jgi:hypothetical protein
LWPRNVNPTKRRKELGDHGKNYFTQPNEMLVTTKQMIGWEPKQRKINSAPKNAIDKGFLFGLGRQIRTQRKAKRKPSSIYRARILALDALPDRTEKPSVAIKGLGESGCKRPPDGGNGLWMTVSKTNKTDRTFIAPERAQLGVSVTINVTARARWTCCSVFLVMPKLKMNKSICRLFLTVTAMAIYCPSFACICPLPDPDAGNKWLKTPNHYYFIGKVLRIVNTKPKTETELLERKVTLKIKKTWQKMGHATISILTGLGGGDCGFQFVKGAIYLIDAEYSYQNFHTDICSQTRKVSDATWQISELNKWHKK